MAKTKSSPKTLDQAFENVNTEFLEMLSKGFCLVTVKDMTRLDKAVLLILT